MQKKIKTDLFEFNYADSLQQLVDETLKILPSKIEEYKKFFDLDFNEKLVLNYFDNKEEFRNFIYDIRGEKESLPSYAMGTYDNEMVNACIIPEKQMNSIYMANHELFHIIYLKYILKNDIEKRIVWYDEGMAKFMSGETDKYKDEDSFKKYYLYVKENTKEYPNLNEVNHGTSFANDKYNVYHLGYLCIKYLYEVLDYDDFKKLPSDIDKIKEYGNNIVNKMFDYYDNKYSE